jgi:hypothetical protein
MQSAGTDDTAQGSTLGGTGEIPRPREDSAATPLARGRHTGAPGGTVPTDDELLERTLTFSGSYVSDDGQVTIRRSASGSAQYTGNRFVGYCRRCGRSLLMPSDGEPLPDIPAAIRFAATHDHGDVD